MDHVIVTNYEGQLTLARGEDLPKLIRAVLSLEADFPPAVGPDDDAAVEILQCWESPTLAALEQALDVIDVGMAYSGPAATSRIYADYQGE